MWILPKQLHTSDFVPATAALNLDLNESSQICAQSLFVRSKPSPLRTWLQKWKRDSWTQHLYGRILKPSLGQSFVTAWTSSLEATPVSPSVQPGSDLEQTTQDIFGPTSQAAFDFFDQSSASSRMSRGTSALDSEKSLTIWKALVTKQRLAYLARLNAVRHTRESECSSSPWPTPSQRDYKGACESRVTPEGYNSRLDEAVIVFGLAAPKNWSTPSTMDTLPPKSPEGIQRVLTHDGRTNRKSTGNLREDVVQFGQAGPDNHSTHGSRPESWLTPRANEPAADANFVARNADRSEHCHVSLTSQVKAWATPEGMAGGKTSRGGKRKNELLLTGQVKQDASGKLNPRWVCVLMNLPVFWVKP